MHPDSWVLKRGVLAEIGKLAAGLGASGFVVVTDSTVSKLGYSRTVARALAATGVRTHTLRVPTGELSKSLRVAQRGARRLADWQIDREAVVVAVGGGVVTDLAGFVASVWLRGVRWIVCPTTLEGMIDAAIGGKTGLNLPEGKNLIGTFHPPTLIAVDPDVLATLPPRAMRAGLAESIKHAAVWDAAFFDWQAERAEPILAGDADVLAELIERNIRAKLAIVGEDLRESGGNRVLLNFGHTFGHAIEAASGYVLMHGECVAIGMTAAVRLSQQLGLLTGSDCDRLTGLVEAFGLPVKAPSGMSVARLLEYMGRDKKRQAGQSRFVLLERIGCARVVTGVAERDVRTAIESILPS